LGGFAGQLEAQMANVVVSALKEVFNRDNARLEMERAQIEDQRKRAEEARQLELRKLTIDREGNRLRLMAGAALLGWLVSVAVLALQFSTAGSLSRALFVAGGMVLLASAGISLRTQGRLVRNLGESELPDTGVSTDASLALLIGGFTVVTLGFLT
jgi:predicted phage tail protein